MNELDINTMMARAETAHKAGDTDTAVDLLQQVISVLADDMPVASRSLGDACRLLADILADTHQMPQAIQMYQEAADAYAGDPACGSLQQNCAERIVQGVDALRKHPEDRLLLLIARYDRELQQLAGTPGTEPEQADILFRTATVLQRRDRFADAAERYQQALSLYSAADGTGLSRAICHQRLGGLYHHELHDATAAAEHYREAIALFAYHETRHDGEQVNRSLCEELLAGLLMEG